MPRFPNLSANAQKLRPSVFTSLAAQFKFLAAPPIPLHLGDTYRSPVPQSRLDQVAARLPANAYAYANPNGLDDLRAAVAGRAGREGLPGLTANHVQVTLGGTGAIHVALGTWLQPGDEVLIMAPFWPLVRGMVLAMGAVPIEVPFYESVRAGRSIDEILSPYLSDRTMALYICSPNNPCGTVLELAQLGEVAKFCCDHDLWAIADEAYEHYAFSPAEHHFLAAQPGMFSRTATIFTASKSYALAGIRVGFLCGDPAWLDVARRVSTHEIYNVPLACQLSALAAIEHGDAWLRETRDLYAEAADITARTLQAKFAPARGGGYVFADLAEDLRGAPLMEFLHALLHQGVSLSPGDAFGKDFPTYVRLCFIAVDLPQLRVALDRLNMALQTLRQTNRAS